MINKNYELRGGLYMETAAIANNLANSGITAPHNNKPFSEALLLGISGGLGAGYSLRVLESYPYKILHIAFHYGWQNRTEKLLKLFERISVPVNVYKTSVEDKTELVLENSLKQGKTPLCWVDHTRLPYFYTSRLHARWEYLVNAFGVDREKNQVWIDDRSSLPLIIGLDQFRFARQNRSKLRHQMITLSAPNQQGNIYQAVKDGLQDCVDNLGQISGAQSLAAYKKWAERLYNPHSKKSWNHIFADRKGLGLTLQTIYENTTPCGPYGGSLRGLYSRFLEEAVHILNLPRLKDAAARYCLLEKKWRDFGSSALPDEIPEFSEIKSLVQLQNKRLRTSGNADIQRIQDTRRRLRQIQNRINEDFPLSVAQADELFAEMQNKLLRIYHEELNALESIKRVLN